MTRQWLTDPDRMCTRHLLGEHAETHMFLTKMQRGYSLEGFRDSSMFFGAEYVKARHDLVATYFSGHQTPLEISSNLSVKYPLVVPQMHDLRSSLSDLLGRCRECAHKHAQYLREALGA